jgi:hypothetical protein
MWHVLKHLYYEKTRAGPLMEYVVCEARVTGYFQGGYTVRMGKEKRGGKSTLTYFVEYWRADNEG